MLKSIDTETDIGTNYENLVVNLNKKLKICKLKSTCYS